MHRFFIALVLFFACTVTASHSQANDSNAAAEHLASMQNAYSVMTSFSASFTQELQHAESGSVEKRSGTLIFAKPLLARWETDAPNKELLIVNEKEVWNYIPDEAVAYKHPVSIIDDSRAFIRLITGTGRMDKDFIIEAEPDRGDGFSIRLYPKEPTTQLVEIFVVIDKKTSLLNTVEIIDFYGNVNTIRFTSIRPDPHIKQKTFFFVPPPDVTVETPSAAQ